MATSSGVLTKFDPSAFFTVRVGKGKTQKDFIVHEYYAYRSGFFRRAMNGNWAESSTRVVKMPEDDSEQFSLYIGFLYTGKIPPDTTKVDEQYTELARIYGLADQLQDASTMNTAMRQFYTIFTTSHPPPVEVVNLFYMSTPANSPIRMMLVDMWSGGFWSECTLEKVEMLVKSLPQEFLASLLHQLGKQRDPRLKCTALAADLRNYMVKD